MFGLGRIKDQIVNLVRSRHAEIPPDSTPVWRLWMASEALPSLVAGIRLGVFELLKPNGGKTEGEIRAQLKLSSRAARVLLHQLTSLGFLRREGSRSRYVLTADSRKLLKSSLRVSRMIREAVTPQSYLRAIRKNAPRHREIRKDALGWIESARFHFPILAAAVELGLTKLLAERAVKFAAIAETLEIPPQYLREMLECLHGYQIVRSNGAGQWSLTEIGRAYALVDDKSPYNWSGILHLMTENPPTPLSLWEAIRKEQASVGQPDEGQMMEHVMSPALARVFAKHMHSQGAASAVAVAKHWIFKRARRVLDVAGGGGTYSFEIAGQNPHLSATVLELSPMDRVAAEWIRFRGLRSHVHVRTGNMFFTGDWPKQTHDVVFFSHVMHDWDVPKIKMLLRNAFTALPAGGKVVLHEVLADGAGHKRAVADAFSVTLYKWTEGRQYSASELITLLRSAGFSVSETEISPAHGPSSLIIATKVLK